MNRILFIMLIAGLTFCAAPRPKADPPVSPIASATPVVASTPEESTTPVRQSPAPRREDDLSMPMPTATPIAETSATPVAMLNERKDKGSKKSSRHTPAPSATAGKTKGDKNKGKVQNRGAERASPTPGQ